jgi:hypothetical protein
MIEIMNEIRAEFMNSTHASFRENEISASVLVDLFSNRDRVFMILLIAQFIKEIQKAMIKERP